MENKRIFLVEDDPSLGFVIEDNLKVNGYTVSRFEDGLEAKGAFKNREFDLCILDIMLPKMDGFTLAGHIRKVNKNIPILFLTAKSMQEDKLKGFQLGADDYITKPFSMEELLCRIEVFLKRSTAPPKPLEKAQLGDYIFNYKHFALEFGDSIQKLTRREADLLQYLIAHKGVVLKREEILNEIWGDDDYFKGRSLDVFISKLRKYLKDDERVDIANFHGIGFKFEIQE